MSAISVTVRYFAAARAAAGIDEESMAFPGATPVTVQTVIDAVASEHGDSLTTVLSRCSYLHNAVVVRDPSAAISDGDAIDVLPPFAGG